jgi:hypothetical protein
LIPITFEAEQHIWHKEELDWDRQDSELGYDHAFKSGDFPDRLLLRAKHWEEAADGKQGLQSKYKDTAAALESCRVAQGNLGSRTKAQVADEYESQLLGGIDHARNQFWKFNKEWFLPSHLLCYLRSEKFRQIAAIYLAACWEGEEPDYSEVPDELTEQLTFWTTNIRKYGSGAEAVKEWLVDLKIMGFRGGNAWSQVRLLACEGSKHRFLKGGLDADGEIVEPWLNDLDDFIYYNVDVIAFTNLVNELSFSALKQCYAKGENAWATDMKMFWIFVTTHRERAARSTMVNKQGPRAGLISQGRNHTDTIAKKRVR